LTTDQRLEELRRLLHEAPVIVDPAVMERYRQDWACDPGAGEPLAVIRPATTEHVQAVMKWASKHRVVVIPRGAGSGLSGGATAVDGCAVVTTELMRDIVVDTATRTAIVQPGLINIDVKREAAKHGLWYPPDPSSYEMCSIGGNVATNAGGLCCVKYGVTADYVLGLTVVLADGTVVKLGGPLLKDAAGLSLTKLFIGSEGTLGFITEVIVRLVPAQPPTSTVVATFRTIEDCIDAVLGITRHLRPAMLELMDQASIGAVESAMTMGLDRSCGGMLIAQSDARGDDRAREIELMSRILADSRAIELFATDDPDEGDAFTAARRFAVPAVEKLGSVLLEDVGVPLPQLPALIRGIHGIAAQRDVLIAVVAHAGDGNTHPLIVHDPLDENETRQAGVAFGEIMNLAISLGGTITGEHGVGRLKKAWLQDQIGAGAMDLTRRIKSALDPQGILNPGVIL
jgi:glycolate oxidase